MSEPLEPQLVSWMATVGRVDPTDVRELVRGMELPVRQRRRAVHATDLIKFAAVAAVLVAIAVGVVLSTGALSPEPTPPDPRAFAGDPRLDRCTSAAGAPASDAFELEHAADYVRVLPAMLRSPELERPDPAFVVVFRAGDASTDGVLAPTGEGRTVCVIVGSGLDAELNLYSEVDLTGFTRELVRRFGPAPGVTVAPVAPSATPTSAVVTTPMPGTEALAVPTPTASPSWPRGSGPAAVSRDEAVAIARDAGGKILSWLADYPVETAEIRSFGDVRSSYDPMPVPGVPDDRLVWLIVLADSGSGQGLTAFIDATDGSVLYAVSWIT